MSPQTSFTAATEAQLNADLALINSGGADAAAGTAYTITLSASLSLTTALTAINLLGTSSLTLAGGGFTIDGNNAYAGFDVAAGSAILANLTIQHTVAQGGAGGTGQGIISALNLLQGGGGGGGAGLGGGLFVASGASATLQSVTFAADSATGGAGSGTGGMLSQPTAGGGANGGTLPGLVGGLLAGGGGGGQDSGGAGGGLGLGAGGAGSFGGGGGGGGGVTGAGGAGGFGGGGGGANTGTAAGGFGGGAGNATDGGGGGLGAGADVFVQTGGTLAISSGTLGAGTVTGGAGSGGAGAGLAFGSGIFAQSGTIALAPASGQIVTVNGGIADPNGSVSGSNAGAAALLMQGVGTVLLAGADSFSGGSVLASGTLELGVATAAGSGAINFASPAAKLKLDTNTLANGVSGLVSGDMIDLAALSFVAGQTTATQSADGATLAVANGTLTDTLTLIGLHAGTSFHTASDGAGGTLVQIGATAPPTITAIAASPAAGDFGAGTNIAITLTPSTAVTVAGGTPTLTLNDGGIATYNATASTPTALVFGYTVAAGQDTPSLGVSSISLNGATITDSVGNVFNPAAALPALAGPRIDTSGPSVIAIASTPANGDFTTATGITLTLTTNAAVTVTGAPTLTLNDGATALYSATGSTSTQLAFTYTVLPGQNVSALGVTAINLNGGTIDDAASAPLNLAVALPAYAGPKIDTTAPTIAAIAATPANGTLNTGNTVTITLTPSEAVSVTGGTPTLVLNDLGTATYSAAASSPTSLVFTYTVAAGQNTNALGVTAILDNGATIADGAGNALSLTSPLPSFAGPTVNTVTPTIIAIASTPAAGDLDAGHVVTLALTPSEAVTVSGGTPTLTLNDGGIATYTATGSTTTSLLFTTTVAAGQNAAALGALALQLNGATISDTLGNQLNPANPLPAYAGPQIDTTPPVVTAISSTPATGDFDAGQLIALLVTFSEAVTVTGGAPSLTLNDGTSAAYNAAASTATVLAFSTTVGAGQNAATLGVTALALNGAVIADGAGNAVNTAAALPAYSGPQIDTTPPTATAITSTSTLPNGTTSSTAALPVGSVLHVAVAMSEPVTVTGSPTLTMTDGGTAIYNAASSTLTSLDFDYTVAAGDNAAAIGVQSFNLNGGRIADNAGNLFTPPAGPALPPYVGPPIDSATPSIISIVATPGVGPLDVGAVVTLTVTPNEALFFTGGTPSFTLNDGGTATYNAAISTPLAMSFTYTVAAGENTTSLEISGFNLNGATITDGAGNVLTPAAAADVPALNGPAIDTAAPVITAITADPPTGDFTVGSTVTLDVMFNKAAVITGGTPSLTLNDGGTATFDSIDSTPTTKVFTYKVAAGNSTPSLSVQSFNLNGATLTSAAGIAATALASLPANSGPMIDTTPPTIVSVVATPPSGTLGVGGVVNFSVTLSKAVLVSGPGPVFALNDGGIATYDAALSTPTVADYIYTVTPGQNTPLLAITSFSLNGSTITDPAGNTLAVPNGITANFPAIPAPAIDTTTPTILSVGVSPAAGDLDAGKEVDITFTLNQAVTFTGGVPSLSLNDGGVATYNPALSTPTKNVFSTIIAAGQNTSSLELTGFNLNGASILDSIGDVLSPAPTPPAINGPMIDTTAPFIVAITGTPASGPLVVGQVITLMLTTSEAVTVTGGVPSVTLNDGGTATYQPAASTPTSLVFTSVVGLGQAATTLAAQSLKLNGATIADGAGNPIDLSQALPAYNGPPISTGAPTVPVLTLAPGTATPTVTGTGPASSTITVSVNGTPVGTTTSDGTGAFTFPLPASVPVGIDSVTATATNAAGTVSAPSVPLVVAIGPVLDWISPVNGGFPASGNWEISGTKTAATPNASNTAEFATGSATPYVVSGNGTAARINVTGDQVTTTGQLAAIGLADTGGTRTDLAITAGGKLTIGAASSLSTVDAVTLGGGSAGTLAVTNKSAFSAPAGLVLGAGGILLVDNSAVVTGAVTLNGGTLDAIPLAGGTAGAAMLTNAVTLAAGKTETAGSTQPAGSTGGALLELAGTVAGAGALTVVGNLILANAANSFAGGIIVAGGSLELAVAGAGGSGVISSLAGTTNTIRVDAGPATIASNGFDSIVLGSGAANIATTGAASIVGGAGSATVSAAGSAVTVTAGSGNLTVGGSADLVESAPNGGSVAYTGTGHITYVGSGTGSETISALSGSTITTGSGTNRVNLGSGRNIVTSTGNDTIQASSGTDTITATGKSVVVTGGSGTLYFAGNASSATVTGGSGTATIFGGSGGGMLTGGSGGNNLVIAGGGNTSVTGGGRGDQLYGSPKGADMITAGSGAETLVAGSGSETLAGVGGDILFGGGGTSVLLAGSAGGDTVVSGAGTSLLSLKGGDLAFGGVGSATVLGSAGGHDTLVAGSGTTTMALQGNEIAFGSAGKTIVTAGTQGNDIFVGGIGSTQIALGGHDVAFMGGGSNVVFGSAAGGDDIVAGAGSITVTNGAGGETFIGGTGAASVTGGTGNDVVFGGTGTTVFTAGSGNDEVLFQSGATTVIGGSGADLYAFNLGQAGGQDVISGFKVGTDQIDLFGYGANAVTSVTSGSAGTSVVLSDGTNIQLLGVAALAANSIVH